jgi:hypothetical protein
MLRYICVSVLITMLLQEQLLISTSNEQQSKLLKDLASQLGLKVEVVAAKAKSVKTGKKVLDETAAFHSRAKHRRNPTILKHI